MIFEQTACFDAGYHLLVIATTVADNWCPVLYVISNIQYWFSSVVSSIVARSVDDQLWPVIVIYYWCAVLLQLPTNVLYCVWPEMSSIVVDQEVQYWPV